MVIGMYLIIFKKIECRMIMNIKLFKKKKKNWDNINPSGSYYLEQPLQFALLEPEDFQLCQLLAVS